MCEYVHRCVFDLTYAILRAVAHFSNKKLQDASCLPPSAAPWNFLVRNCMRSYIVHQTLYILTVVSCLAVALQINFQSQKTCLALTLQTAVLRPHLYLHLNLTLGQINFLGQSQKTCLALALQTAVLRPHLHLHLNLTLGQINFLGQSRKTCHASSIIHRVSYKSIYTPYMTVLISL